MNKKIIVCGGTDADKLRQMKS